MSQRNDELRQEEYVHETLLDLGPGESWLHPDKEAVERVTAALLTAGCAAESVEHLSSHLVKLTGRRIQDVIALAQMTDAAMEDLILEASERLDWLVGVLRYGHPDGEAERHSLEDEEPFERLRHSDHAERILPPGSQRARTSFARSLKSSNIDIDEAARLLQKIKEGIWLTPSRPLKRELIDKVGYETALAQFAPLGVRNASEAAVEKAAKLAYSTVKHGRSPVPEALVDWVAATADSWKGITGKRPGKTRDLDGHYTGPFFDLLEMLLSVYPAFQATGVTRTVVQKGLERARSRDK